MDVMELVMLAEEKFDITVEDQEIEHFTTAGSVCALIERKLGFAATDQTSLCPTSRAFYQTRRALIQQGIERARVTPATSLESLWPRFERANNWRALGNALELPLPPLQRSPEWAFLLLLPLGLFPIVCIVAPSAISPLLSAYVFLWVLGERATKSFATHPPSRWQTVGDLSRHLALRLYEVNLEERPKVWVTLRHLIADEFNRPLDKITRDADLVRDLGLG